jgi:hypothetical protein
MSYNGAKGPTMKFVYVLEDDPKFQKEIAEAIAAVDPKIQIRLFTKLQTFVEWLKVLMTTGPAAVAQGGTVQQFVPQEDVPENEAHQLVMVISKVEFMGSDQLDLLRKTRKLFVDRQVCTVEDPTAFVLTAFDNPDFEIRKLENPILNNVILKPFDRLILIQHLTFAIDGRHPPTKNTVTNQKTTAVVELLKDIEMEAVSDVGFLTKSEREIQPGVVCKYYSQTFLSDRHRSLFAICRDCVKHPTLPNMFQASFTYFAVDQTQISNMRKKTRQKDVKEIPYSWAPPVKDRYKEFHIVLLDDEELGPSGIIGKIEKTFSSVKTSHYTSFGSFYSDLDPTRSLEQRDSSVKALGGANSVTLHFDQTGHTYLECVSDKQDLMSIFGTNLSELKAKGDWFSHALSGEHKEKFRKYIQTGALQDDNFLVLTINEAPFIVKVSSANKDGNRFHLTIIEPTKEEQLQCLEKNSRLQKAVHLIIANHRLFGDGAVERWTAVKESLMKRFNVEVKIIMTSKKDFSDAEERGLGAVLHDIFFKPVDPGYLVQKIKTFFPGLSEKLERVKIPTVAHSEILKAVNPVKVIEISEAGFILEYTRPIDIGNFREVVLWQPYEIGAPELLATCNFVEESPAQKGVHNCHFVFFAATDYFLKHIRVWIRDNYVLSKEGQAS